MVKIRFWHISQIKDKTLNVKKEYILYVRLLWLNFFAKSVQLRFFNTLKMIIDQLIGPSIATEIQFRGSSEYQSKRDTTTGTTGSIKNEAVKEPALPVLKKFGTIALDRMNEVTFQNRFDSKYIFHFNCLPDILEQVKDDYYLLDVNGELIQVYQTIYYDTPSDRFYISHHNGKLNRIKIRKRCYLNSGTCFLEVKKKDNKGKMKKIRMLCASDHPGLCQSDKRFIAGHTPDLAESLMVKMKNSFNRITLVNKNFNERCTIDFNLQFMSEKSSKAIEGLVVAELKHERFKSTSILGKTFRTRHIYEDSFSKYCMGRALLQPALKRNRFKPAILNIDRKFKLISHE